MTYITGDINGAIALTEKFDLNTIHSITFRLQELRRDPRERQKEVLVNYFHEEFLVQDSNRDWVSEALGLN